MPRAARYRNPAFEELERQLLFAPPDALRRQMDAAERLAHEVEDEATYPFEFVVWRLTGFRAEDAAIKPMDGLTLRGDLATFVLHASERILITHDERPGGAVALSDLADELGVTEKTLRRWRNRGLVAHRIELADGRTRVGVFRDEVERFTARYGELVGDAKTFSRMGGEAETAAVARVRELVRAGRSPNLAAKAVAVELSRSHETIRQLLLRAGIQLGNTPVGRKSESPGRQAGRGRERFSRRALDRSAWERRLAFRAWRFGVAVERIAEASGTSVDAVRRRIDAVRAERLRAMRLSWIEFPTFERPDAAETILAGEAARCDLAPMLEPADVVGMLAHLKQGRWLSGGPTTTTAAPGQLESADEAMLAAYNFLKREARHGIVELGKAPARADIDRIETDLRWALRLKRRLVERMLPLALLRVEQGSGGPMDRRPAEEVRSLLQRCVHLISEVIESVDPAKRQTLRRLVALDTDRMLAQLSSVRGTRAGVRHEPGTIAMRGLFDGVVGWADVVDPFAALAPSAARLPKEHASLLARRYGWDGAPPATLEALAATERTTVARITARTAVAERLLRAIRRGA
ncbi:MAG: hypothetical protein JNL80_14415 [Phycisphaerae bacterium]|nr:hypothetical protein [Phycisphaerae bacterium]